MNRRLHLTNRNIDFALECNILVCTALYWCKITYIKRQVMPKFNVFAIEMYVRKVSATGRDRKRERQGERRRERRIERETERERDGEI